MVSRYRTVHRMCDLPHSKRKVDINVEEIKTSTKQVFNFYDISTGFAFRAPLEPLKGCESQTHHIQNQ